MYVNEILLSNKINVKKNHIQYSLLIYVNDS